jgi:hydrogenase-4 membrane subunit HyfE
VGVLFGLTAVVQTVLHYLGLLGVLLGIVAFVAGNSDRGVELLVGGAVLLVLKYVIGVPVVLMMARQRDSQPTSTD